ncbi:prepilin-type N-terminal cleavage/methylation domain-containing protein [Lagierella sp.]|uniref:prepilin-type N-terminal cleavage/methylation domain-containing protein n=1 Tax=Lagierella sp. TaxID=2849657 RepID=UPI00262D615E|nr:prepilin-type N-terminal cleavage/methylation domain-containing protein [Lagierella sp.]
MKRFFHNKKTKGFTLLELILALGISLIVISVIGVLLGYSLKVLKNDFIYRKKEGSVAYASTYIEREIGRSLKIYSPEEFPYDLKDNNLGFVLEIWPYEDLTNHDYVYYYLSENKLRRALLRSHKPIEENGRLNLMGTNNISDGILDVSKTYFNRKERYINLNFTYEEESTKEEYVSGIYVEVEDED